MSEIALIPIEIEGRHIAAGEIFDGVDSVTLAYLKRLGAVQASGNRVDTGPKGAGGKTRASRSTEDA